MPKTHALPTAFGPRGLARPTAATRLLVQLREAIRSWAKNRRQRMTVNSLMALDDRALKDIGLTRSEILSTVYNPDKTPFTRVHPYS